MRRYSFSLLVALLPERLSLVCRVVLPDVDGYLLDIGINGSSSHGSAPRLDFNGLGRPWAATLLRAQERYA